MRIRCPHCQNYLQVDKKMIQEYDDNTGWADNEELDDIYKGKDDGKSCESCALWSTCDHERWYDEQTDDNDRPCWRKP